MGDAVLFNDTAGVFEDWETGTVRENLAISGGLEDSPPFIPEKTSASDYDPFGVDYPSSTPNKFSSRAFPTTTAPRDTTVPTTTTVAPPSSTSAAPRSSHHAHPVLHPGRALPVDPRRQDRTPVRVGSTRGHPATVSGDVLFPENQPDRGGLKIEGCLLYTSPSPRDRTRSRMPSSA